MFVADLPPPEGSRPPLAGCQAAGGKKSSIDAGPKYEDSAAESSAPKGKKAKKTDVPQVVRSEAELQEAFLEQRRIALLRANPPRWMSGQDSAHYTGYSEGFICTEATVGRIKSTKRGRMRRFHVDHLDAWLSSGGRA